MLHSIKELNGFSLVATDGELGKVEDVFFDDEKWTIRHLVVDTGGWLGGRRVLISPISIGSLDWDDDSIHVDLTMQQVKDSPEVDTTSPLSRQHEVEFYNHYGYPYYWMGPFAWGPTLFPGMADMKPNDEAERLQPGIGESEDIAHADPHLRSAKEVLGYTIRATDDELGHVEDFLFNDEDWSIQLIVIDPRNWWPGKSVLVSPRRINQVNWAEQRVEVALTRTQVEASPEYDPVNLATAEVEHELYFGKKDAPPDNGSR